MSVALPSSIPPELREAAAGLVRGLGGLDGVAAVGLGGSFARGTAGPDSDVDLAVYYRESAPFSLEQVGALARAADAGGEPVVAGFFEWGPWVNGGAWIHTRAGRVDLLWRSLEHVERVLADASAGRFEWHWWQQPPYGHPSVVYLAETRDCVPLVDPEGALAALARSLPAYPDALRARIVSECGWSAEFTLLHARAWAERGDAYGCVGSLARAAACLTQVLHALNRVYFAGDKGALEAIERMPRRPEGYAHRVRDALAVGGADRASLATAAAAMTDLFAEVAALCGDLYRPRSPLPRMGRAAKPT
jgi:hypothetical protein